MVKREKIDKIVEKLLNFPLKNYNFKERYVCNDECIGYNVYKHLDDDNPYSLCVFNLVQDNHKWAITYTITEDQYLKLRERRDEITDYIENLQTDFILNEIN